MIIIRTCKRANVPLAVCFVYKSSLYLIIDSVYIAAALIFLYYHYCFECWRLLWFLVCILEGIKQSGFPLWSQNKIQGLSIKVDINFQALNVDIWILNCGCNNLRMTRDRSERKFFQRKYEIRLYSANMPNVYNFMNFFQFSQIFSWINFMTFKDLEAQIQGL